MIHFTTITIRTSNSNGETNILKKTYLIWVLLFITFPFIHIAILESIKPFYNIKVEYSSLINSYMASSIVLIGVLITIHQSKQQDKDNFRLQHMPYLEIDYIPKVPTSRDGGTIIFGEHEDHTHKVVGYFKITNNGFGPAMDLSITEISYNYNMLNLSIISNKILKPEESIQLLVIGYFKIQDIENQHVDNFYKINANTGPLIFDLVYTDFIGNKYVFEVETPYQISGMYDENGNKPKFEFTTSINMKRTNL
jgi:hypothetical protein